MSDEYIDIGYIRWRYFRNPSTEKPRVLVDRETGKTLTEAETAEVLADIEVLERIKRKYYEG